MALMLYIIVNSVSFKQAIRRAYLIFLFFNLFALYWISSWSSNDIFIKIGGIAVILIHPIFFLVPIILFWLTLRNISLATGLFFFPFFWTGFEYFHNVGQLAFPWIELGNTETYNTGRVQYIDYTGLHGITFLICIIIVIIFYLAYKINTREWSMKSRESIVCASVIILLILIPNLYSSIYLNSEGIKRFTDYTSNSQKTLKAAIIQTNIDPWKKWSAPVPEIDDSLIKKLEAAVKLNPELIVLHETAVPFYFFSEYYINETNKFIDFANKNRKHLMMGIPYLYYYNDSNTAPKDSRIMKGSGKRYDTFNSAVLIEPNMNPSEFKVYSKSRLVPVSERIPYQEYVPFLQNTLKWGVGISSWQIGKDMTIFRMQEDDKSFSFAVLICFESAFSEYASEFVKNGAEFLVVITNDGWFGKSSGPYQHQQFAVLRAIENRKWIIRSAQTGISCFIDPLGNTYDKTELFTESTIAKDIIANNEKTFYAEHGDVIGKISYGISVFMLVINGIVFLKRRKEKVT
jgi:apolipoprotein N-acyltransferase